jgi:hypothetical protein
MRLADQNNATSCEVKQSNGQLALRYEAPDLASSAGLELIRRFFRRAGTEGLVETDSDAVAEERFRVGRDGVEGGRALIDAALVVE